MPPLQWCETKAEFIDYEISKQGSLYNAVKAGYVTTNNAEEPIGPAGLLVSAANQGLSLSTLDNVAKTRCQSWLQEQQAQANTTTTTVPVEGCVQTVNDEVSSIADSGGLSQAESTNNAQHVQNFDPNTATNPVANIAMAAYYMFDTDNDSQEVIDSYIQTQCAQLRN